MCTSGPRGASEAPRAGSGRVDDKGRGERETECDRVEEPFGNAQQSCRNDQEEQDQREQAAPAGTINEKGLERQRCPHSYLASVG